ncbi:MAG: class I SAM-dependent methyltransferase [Sphingobacteriales bacterium]|nr:MAG: class I SAM-dependent methyltransferase [Sphingobacteriales bacterium]
MATDQQLNQKFYDELSGDYHLLFTNWDEAMQQQARTLDQLIQKYATGKTETLLDCACGIGTQALGLAQSGYNTTATDLSPKAIERAQQEAQKRQVQNISFATADFTRLETSVKGTFDIVIACDNALPHLLTDEVMSQALKSIASKINPGGLFLASIRDYDALLNTRPTSTLPVVNDNAGSRSIAFQVWDWITPSTYTVNHFTLKGQGANYDTRLRQTTYRAYQRATLSLLMTACGFKAIHWLLPAASGYYQPIVIAHKS